MVASKTRRRPAGSRATRKPKRRAVPAAAPVEEQIHKVFVAREEERCRKLEAEYALNPKTAGKKVARQPVPKPWSRPGPQALLQDPDLLLLVSEFDYDLAAKAFQKYCRERGVLHVAGEEGSRRREFFKDHALTKDAFLADPYFRFAQPSEGGRHEYTPHEMDVAWEIVCLGRAKLQDAWELYRSAKPRPASEGMRSRSTAQPRPKVQMSLFPQAPPSTRKRKR